MAQAPRKHSSPIPLKLLDYDPKDWQQPGDASWQVFERWKAARKAWCEAHPDAEAVLGNALDRMQYEMSIQHPAMFGHLRHKRSRIQ